MSFTQLAGKRAVVTGATGFIGGRLVEALVAAGADVTAVTRSRHGQGALKAKGMSVVDVRDDAGLARALDGAVFFNFAYDVRASGAENFASFERLMGLAGGALRVVHASSIVVYDDWPVGDLSEGSPIGTDGGGDYRQTKITMERHLEGREVAILQPTIVYGRGSALWTDAVLERLRTGPVILPDCPSVCNAVHVDDVVQAAMRAAVGSGFGRYIVSGGGRESWDDFYRYHIEVFGVGEIRREPLAVLRDRLGPVSSPTGGPSLAAKVSAQLRQVIGRERFEGLVRRAKSLRTSQGPVFPDRSMLALYSGTGFCDIAKAQAELGYAPEFDLKAGILASAETD